MPDRRGKFDREELKLVVGQKPAGLARLALLGSDPKPPECNHERVRVHGAYLLTEHVALPTPDGKGL